MTEQSTIMLQNLDVSDPSLYQQERWAPYFRRLRHEDPVHYCAGSAYGPYWSITRFDDVMDIELDHETFSSSAEYGGIRIHRRPGGSFLASDPPRHTRERKAVAAIASPTNLARYDRLIRERTNRLLASLPRNEPFNWVSAVSSELTVTMLATLFDFPLEERHKLAFWSDAHTCEPAPDAPIESQDDLMVVQHEMVDIFRGLWNERINQELKPDLISMMAHSPDMRNMTEREFTGNLALLVIGGYETTKNSMTGSILALAENPDQRMKLEGNPSLVPSLVGEVLRYQSPIIHMCRTATRDTVFRDRLIRKGDRVVLWYISANRDGSAITEPDQFIIDRQKPNRHLSFGAGIHRCVGDKLATVQLKILWEEILAQELVIDIDGEPLRQYSNFIRGFSHLPVQVRAWK